MAQLYFFYLVVLALIAFTVVTAPTFCNRQTKMKKFHSVENKKLKASYRQVDTSSHVLCVSYCHADPQCHSVNYNIDNHLCELINATRAQYPDEFVTDPTTWYFDAEMDMPLTKPTTTAPQKTTATLGMTTKPTTTAPQQTTTEKPHTTLPPITQTPTPWLKTTKLQQMRCTGEECTDT